MTTLSRSKQRGGLLSGWDEFCQWVTSADNRIRLMTKTLKQKSVDDLFEKNSRVEPQKIWAETWNGRAAMVGLFAAAISDLTTGHMFFGIF